MDINLQKDEKMKLRNPKIMKSETEQNKGK